jgi:SAM-dependent methyltransferase
MDDKAYKKLEVETGRAGARGSLDWYRKAYGVCSEIEIHTVLRHLAPTTETRVLDMGCGVGRIALFLAPRVGQITAVDIAPANIDMLNEHARERRLTNVIGRVSDMNELGLDGERFDAAVAVQSIQHIPSAALRMDAVRRIHAALNPRGRFVTVNYRWGGMIDDEKEGTHSDGRYRYSFTPEELRNLLHEAGFKDITVGGCVNTPSRLLWLAETAPRMWSQFDAALSFMPISRRMGRYVIATGLA